MENIQTEELLQSILDTQKREWANKAPEEIKRIYKEGIEDVERNRIIENAFNIGDTAPNFSLQNAIGKTISLEDTLATGPVILTWYRGGWCPYCNLTLQRLQQELENFHALGANLMALTPELPDKSLSTSEKHNLKFEVLSDVGNAIARAYGIVFKLTPEVAETYNLNFDLESYNGNTNNELPLAATYVIGQDQKIKYAFLDAEYRNRAEPAEIIDVLKSL